MKIEDIMSEWSDDCRIDKTNLAEESLKISELHNKYMKIFMGEVAMLKKYATDKNKLKHMLTEYYGNNEWDVSDYEYFGREPFPRKIMKADVDRYIDSDEEWIQMTLKYALQEEKVKYIQEIIKSISNRGFQIKNAIDFTRFKQGYD